VDKLKTCEAKLSAHDKAHRAEVKDLKKKLSDMNENFEVAKAKQEISEMERARVQKNVEELRDSKERCYEASIECTRKLKDSFAKVGSILFEAKIYPC
jgi:predicted nuclease with TOPRIM domain